MRATRQGSEDLNLRQGGCTSGCLHYGSAEHSCLTSEGDYTAISKNPFILILSSELMARAGGLGLIKLAGVKKQKPGGRLTFYHGSTTCVTCSAPRLGLVKQAPESASISPPIQFQCSQKGVSHNFLNNVIITN